MPLYYFLRNLLFRWELSTCPHRRVVPTAFYGGQCVDCGRQTGEGSNGTLSKEELEEAWAYSAARRGADVRNEHETSVGGPA